MTVSDVGLALGELVSIGLAASDGFAGLRGLIGDKEHSPRDAQMAGRWAALMAPGSPGRGGPSDAPLSGSAPEGAIELQARALLTRYGVVCRRLLAREPNAPAWRALARVYRQLEARGEIRGGRFVSGLAGEQFALPAAVERLREVRRTRADDALIVISGADPLNLAGIVTSGDRVPAVAATRICYRNGVPVAAMEGDYIRPLATIDPAIAADVASALAGRRVPPVLSGFVGRVS
jgi:ATP-dependent Lhr-like helicase